MIETKICPPCNTYFNWWSFIREYYFTLSLLNLRKVPSAVKK